MRVAARAKLPTVQGEFEIVAFERGEGVPLEHVALVRGTMAGAERVPLRVHSECMTGDVLASLRCDCREQLEKALRDFGKLPKSVLLYMRQEGRGIGLVNKIRAYHLQQTEGLDTVDANRHLGFEPDARDYTDAAHMLQCLGVRSVLLYTNNPSKVRALEENGIEIVKRVPLHIKPNEHNASYLLAKQRRLGHL